MSKSKFIGQYQLGEVIGKGGFGVVYKGLNIDNGEFVAVKQVPIKQLCKEQIEDIQGEINLLKQLDHMYIVRYIDHKQTDESLYIVIEFVENGSLQNVIKKFGMIPESLVALYISQVLQGLSYLHQEGVIHRDIKGANILTTKDSTVKLADFGVAAKMSDIKDNDGVVGTPYWMAPEIIELNPPTVASDIWSVGSTVVELLTGAPPYYNLSQMQALYRIVQDDHPPLPPDISPALKDFLLLCFQKDPNLRQTAKDLLKHPWIKSAQKKQSAKPNFREATEEVKKFNQMNESYRNSIRVSSTAFAEAFRKLSASREGMSFLEQFDILNKTPRTPASTEVRQEVVDNKNDDNESDSDSIDWPSSDDEPKSNSLFSDNNRTNSVNSVDRSLKTTSTMIVNKPNGHAHSQSEIPPTGLHALRAKFHAAQRPGSPNKKFAISTDFSHLNVNFAEPPPKNQAFELKNIVDPNLMITNAGALSKYKDEDDDFKDFDDDNDDEAGGKIDFASALKNKLQSRATTSVDIPDDDEEDDPFDDEFEEIDPTAVAEASKKESQAQEILRLISLLTPEQSETNILAACQELITIFKQFPGQKSQLVSHHGVLPIMEMLDVSNPSVIHAILRVVNQIIADNKPFQETLCLVGVLPAIMKFGSRNYNTHIREEASFFVNEMCHTSPLTLQMFIACRGLPVLVEFFECSDRDYEKTKKIIFRALDGILQVFHIPNSRTPKNDFCRLLAKNQIMVHLSKIMICLIKDKEKEAAHYLDSVANILIVFSQADTVVKGYMTQTDVLKRIVGCVQVINNYVVKLKILKCVKNLSIDPTTWDNLEKVSAIPILVDVLNRNQAQEKGVEMQNQVIGALFNLCKISKKRQESAATAGIIPHLMRIVRTDSPLKQCALPMIVDLSRTSKKSRQELMKHNGIEFYLDMLEDPHWQVNALEALSIWISAESKVGKVLIAEDNITKICHAFEHSRAATATSLLAPLKTILLVSKKVNQAIGQSSFMAFLVKKIQQQYADAGIRLELLKILRIIFEQHARPKVLIQEHALFSLMKVVSEEDKGLLVKTMAKNLLKMFEAYLAK